MSAGWNMEEKCPMPAGEQFVTLVVKDDAGHRLVLTMRRTDELQVLVNFYYTAMAPAVKHGDGVFVHHRSGRQIIFLDQTPHDYNMMDGDVIDFVRVVKRDVFVSLVLDDELGRRRFVRTMRRTDKMQTMIDFFYDMVPAAAPDGAVFLDPYGRSVRGEKTPADLSLEDGDKISVLPEPIRNFQGPPRLYD